MFAVCVTRLSTRETKISTNVFADRSAATLRHLGYICTIVNRFFKLCISSPSSPLSLSLYFMVYGICHACTKIRNASTARSKLVPTYHRVTSPIQSSTNGSESLYLTAVVSTGSHGRWKVDLLFLFEGSRVYFLKKGILFVQGVKLGNCVNKLIVYWRNISKRWMEILFYF